MTVGLKAVRELSLRCPLVMSEELLQVRRLPAAASGWSVSVAQDTACCILIEGCEHGMSWS
jgi:hypothetical protein